MNASRPASLALGCSAVMSLFAWEFQAAVHPAF